MHFCDAKGILSADNGMNIYRGCTHGCIYCDSRSRCYGFTHEFEDVEVKANAVELLESALKRKRKKCMLGTGSMTDPYMPIERRLGNMRRVLETVYRYGFGIAFQTKSDLALRDLDLICKINEKTKCVVQVTLTTADDALCAKIEPNVCVTSARVRMLETLRAHGVPTVVWLCPILPYINDTAENINGIMDCCERAGVYGVISFGMGLTLREGNREYFYAALDKLFPRLKQRYVREFGGRYEVSSPNNAELSALLRRRCEAAGIVCDNDKIFAYLRELPQARYVQPRLFDDM